MQIQKIEIGKLKAAEYNPRVDLKSGDAEYEKLKRSVQEFGYVEPIIWNKTTGNVVGGHQRLKVLQDLGYTKIDCVVVEIDDQRERALNIALNKIQGAWDNEKLAGLLQELTSADFDVTLTGFDAAEIDALVDEFYSREAIEDNFDENTAQEQIEADGPVTKSGDIWQLGEHRLICGDSTDVAVYKKLMQGKTAQVAVTSPPYGVGKDYEEKGIAPWLATIGGAVKQITKHTQVVAWNLIDLYSTGTQFIEPTTVYSTNLFAEHGFKPIWVRVWKKQGQNHGVAPYHLVTNKPVQQFELVSAYAKNDDAKPEYNDQDYSFISAFAAHSHQFVKRLTREERKNWGYAGIWEINTVAANKDHPAKFPLELPWRCIKMHSDEGGIVLEPFSGSGTTIVAGEQLGRKVYAIELSPKYCDLAVKRWEEFTGKRAVRIPADRNKEAESCEK